jgi:tetratricopeptide (TPR) repeat protein
MKKKSKPRSSDKLDGFDLEVEAALDHFHDPVWLGGESPLAATYMLHDQLGSPETSPKIRGETLHGLLKLAYEQMEDPQPRATKDQPQEEMRSRTIIRMWYFNKPRPKAMALQQKLGIYSPDTYHRSKNAAVRALAAALRHQLKPAMRLESPPTPPLQLFGREDDITSCQRALRSGQTVMLVGSSGVGKTTLASHLAQAWQTQGAVFWYTIRLGLNDQLTNLLFSLGLFLKNSFDDATLWGEVAFRRRPINPENMLGIVRSAFDRILEQQHPAPPLLCFDEVEVLAPSDPAHAQILQFIANLRERALLLIVGQNIELDALLPRTVGALSLREMGDMLKARKVNLSPDYQQRLHIYTQGNPRMVDLFCALRLAGQSSASLLTDLSKMPSLIYLLNRTLRALSRNERALLSALAVFRRPAPADHWQSQPVEDAVLRKLMNYRLVFGDGRGGVELLPAYRDALQSLLAQPRGKAQFLALHQRAAHIWQGRGSYTEAAYHLVQTNDIQAALDLWQAHQEEEINQGQALTALRLFESLKSRDAGMRLGLHNQLQHLCNELNYLVGNFAKALEDIQSMVFDSDLSEQKARYQEGIIHNDQGKTADAKQSFERALTLDDLLSAARRSRLYKGLSYAHMQEGDLQRAAQEALRAQCEAEQQRAVVLEACCEYEQAETHFRTALGFAEAIQHEDSIADNCTYLSILCARLSRFADAEQFFSQAEAIYAKRGMTSYQAGLKINEAFILNLSGAYDRALAAVDKAHAMFERLGPLAENPGPATLICQNRAEAYLGLGQLDLAQQFAHQAIGISPITQTDTLRTLGEICLKRGDTNQAETHIVTSIRQLAQQGKPDAYLTGFAWRSLAQVYDKQGNLAAARNAKKNAIAAFEEIKLGHEVHRTRVVLAHIE